MGCDCGKPKCDGHCGVSPAVLQINNPSECVLFHRVEVPASMGDSKTNPPKSGAYKNVLLYYEADQTSWLYSSDGIPQKLVNGLTNYEDAINLPQINGVTLLGNKSLGDLGITDAIDDAVAEEKAEREAADEALGDEIDIINDELLSRAVVFDTVADMKSAENLVNGSSCRTAGYHAINDGGDAYYRVRQITNEDDVDEGFLVALHNNQLVAELIVEDVYNVKQFGAYGDGVHDDTTIVQNLLDAISSGTMYFPRGRYVLSDSINFCKRFVSIKGDGVAQTVFIDNNTTQNHNSFTIDNFPNADSVYYIENNSYKDFSIIANQYARVGLYVNGTAHCKYENIHVHNVPNVEQNSFGLWLSSEVCSFENVSQPQNENDESYTYAYYGLIIERVSRPGRGSQQSTNNIYNKCIIENSTYNLVLRDGENNVFLSCAIENATTRDITLQEHSKYNAFIGCGTELATTSLLDEGTQSTFINCYMTGDIILASKGVFINGGFYGTFGSITTFANSYGIIQNININHDGTARAVTFGSYNYTFTNVYDEATSSFVYCFKPRTACTLDGTGSWTNTTNKTVVVLISGDFSQVTTVEVKYPGTNPVRCMQPANILIPGASIRITSNDTFGASYTPIE